jgi:hypothetical protein
LALPAVLAAVELCEVVAVVSLDRVAIPRLSLSHAVTARSAVARAAMESKFRMFISFFSLLLTIEIKIKPGNIVASNRIGTFLVLNISQSRMFKLNSHLFDFSRVFLSSNESNEVRREIMGRVSNQSENLAFQEEIVSDDELFDVEEHEETEEDLEGEATVLEVRPHIDGHTSLPS